MATLGDHPTHRLRQEALFWEFFMNDFASSLTPHILVCYSILSDQEYSWSHPDSASKVDRRLRGRFRANQGYSHRLGFLGHGSRGGKDQDWARWNRGLQTSLPKWLDW